MDDQETQYGLLILWALGWGSDIQPSVPSPDALFSALALMWTGFALARSRSADSGILPMHVPILRYLAAGLSLLFILAMGVLLCERFRTRYSPWVQVPLNVSRILLLETLANALALLFLEPAVTLDAARRAVIPAAAGSSVYAVGCLVAMIADLDVTLSPDNTAAAAARLAISVCHGALAVGYAITFLVLRRGRAAIRPYALFTVAWRSITCFGLVVSVAVPVGFPVVVLDILLMAVLVLGFPWSVRAAFKADARYWRGEVPEGKSGGRLKDWKAGRLSCSARAWSAWVRTTAQEVVWGEALRAAGSSGLRGWVGDGAVATTERTGLLKNEANKPAPASQHTGRVPSALVSQALERSAVQWANNKEALPDECLGAFMALVDSCTEAGFLLDFTAVQPHRPVYRGGEAFVFFGTFHGSPPLGHPLASRDGAQWLLPDAKGCPSQDGVPAVRVAMKVSCPVRLDATAMERMCCEAGVNILLATAAQEEEGGGTRKRNEGEADERRNGFQLGGRVGSQLRQASWLTLTDSTLASTGTTDSLGLLLQPWLSETAQPMLGASAAAAGRAGASNLVQFLGACVCPPDSALLFTWCEGGTLREWLDESLEKDLGESQREKDGAGDDAVGEDAPVPTFPRNPVHALVRYSLPSAMESVVPNPILDPTMPLQDVSLGPNPGDEGEESLSLSSQSLSLSTYSHYVWKGKSSSMSLTAEEREDLIEEQLGLAEAVADGLLSTVPAPGEQLGSLPFSLAIRTCQPGPPRLASTAWSVGASPGHVLKDFPWDRPGDWDVSDIAQLYWCWGCSVTTEHSHSHGHRHHDKAGWVQRLMLALDCARGVAFLHGCLSRPLLHRDIKSMNVLLTGAGERQWRAVLSDFGEARMLPPRPTHARPQGPSSSSSSLSSSSSSSSASGVGNGTVHDHVKAEVEAVPTPLGNRGHTPRTDPFLSSRQEAGSELGGMKGVEVEEEALALAYMGFEEVADESVVLQVDVHGGAPERAGSRGRFSYGVGMPLPAFSRAPVRSMTGNVGTQAWAAPEVLRVLEQAAERSVEPTPSMSPLHRTRTSGVRARGGARTQARYGPAADIYSLGLVLWELGTGGEPHEIGGGESTGDAAGAGVFAAAAALTRAVSDLHARPALPPCMPRAYAYMLACAWHPLQECRPPAALIACALQHMLQAAYDYQRLAQQ